MKTGDEVIMEFDEKYGTKKCHQDPVTRCPSDASNTINLTTYLRDTYLLLILGFFKFGNYLTMFLKTLLDNREK